MSSTNHDPAEKERLLLEEGRAIVERLRKAGFVAYFVGGCVRDRLLGHSLKDIDIATDAKPEDVGRLFESSRFVGAKFGVALVRRQGLDFEVATFRKDGLYLNHRHPETVSYGTMEEDARRRDFTVNALYQDPVTEEVVDLAGGLEDLENRLLRCVGEPRQRFNEDALRLLRAIRFAVRMDFKIEDQTWLAMEELAPTIQYISPERQRDELTAILTGPNPARGLRLLDQSGLLHWLLPEIEAMKGVEQGKLWHPEGDVFEHTLLVLENVEPRNAVNAWAALLHDVGKPPTFDRDENGQITFHDHQAIGAEMAGEIMLRLRFPTREIEAVREIVRRHMIFKDVTRMRRSTLRRFLSAPTIEGDLAVHRADCLGSSGRLDYYDFCKEKLEEFAAGEEPMLPTPLINGHDLMAMGFQPGPALGQALSAVREKQLEGELAEKDQALEWVRREFNPLGA